jgi:hypothetical protein
MLLSEQDIIDMASSTRQWLQNLTVQSPLAIFQKKISFGQIYFKIRQMFQDKHNKTSI